MKIIAAINVRLLSYRAKRVLDRYLETIWHKVTGTSSEPIPPTDPMYPDILITPTAARGYTIQLRADRLGNLNDRIYTLNATANDLAGNTATVTATCTSDSFSP